MGIRGAGCAAGKRFRRRRRRRRRRRMQVDRVKKPGVAIGMEQPTSQPYFLPGKEETTI